MRQVSLWGIGIAVVAALLWFALGPEDADEMPRGAARSASERGPDGATGFDTSEETQPTARQRREERAASVDESASRDDDRSDDVVGGGSREIASRDRRETASTGGGSQSAPSAEASARAEASAEAELVVLEARAATVAAGLGLMSPRELEELVTLATKDGSKPPNHIRNTLLADAAIIEHLERLKWGTGPNAKRPSTSGLGHTLIESLTPEQRARKLQEAVEALAPER